MGRRTSVTDTSGTTQFEYDLWDNLVALTDAKNQRTEFEYYPDGKLKLERRPMGEEMTYEYDAQGRLWKILDAKGQTTEYGYDAQSRIETITRSGPGVQSSLCTLSYDADGNLAGYSDGTTSATYTYDDMGRKLSEIVDYGPFSKSFEYTYYGNGLKHTFTAPNGTVYTYNYGLNNELQSVQIPGVGDIAISEYTWNRPKTINYPGGTQRNYTYDSLMRLQSLTVTDSGSNPILAYAYMYDDVGNILTKTTEHGNYTYSYDDSSRLTFADNPALDDESYTYDDIGNRLTSSDVSGSWSYNANNELLGYADVGYEYDANGNMTDIRIAGQIVMTYTYDAANRLVHVEDTAGTISADYYYDPFGRRLWKEVGGTRTYFFYSEEGLIAEYDANGSKIKSYGYKPDSTWTTDPLFLKEGGSYYWYQNDHLGTPQKLTATDGTVVWSAQYTAFGEADMQVETVVNNLRFPGQYYDEEAGLHYNLHRYYDPKIGRYTQADEIGSREGKNLFTYAMNNPKKNSDPLGLWVHPHQIILPEEAVDVVRDASDSVIAGYDFLTVFYPFANPLGKAMFRLLVSLSGHGERLQLYENYNWFGLIDSVLQRHPEIKNGLILDALAHKNHPGGIAEELKSHNRFVFTCKYGWIDMGHFFLTARFAYWARVFGYGNSVDHTIAIGGEYAQEFFRQLTASLRIMHPHGESAFTSEDWLSNRLGTEFGAEVFNEGPQTNIADKWKMFLVESGAVVYDEKMRGMLEEDVRAWWDNYTREPLPENQEDTSCRYTGPREHWNLVKCGATGENKRFPRAYRVLCCCNTRDCPGSCQDTPVDFDRYGYKP